MIRQTFDAAGGPQLGRRRLPLFRAELDRRGLDGFIVPHDDEYQNEYLPAANERLAWLTGFTGSAGAALVLKNWAGILVDGRYTLQVRVQTDTSLFEPRDLMDGGVAGLSAPRRMRETASGMIPSWSRRTHWNAGTRRPTTKTPRLFRRPTIQSTLPGATVHRRLTRQPYRILNVFR